MNSDRANVERGHWIGVDSANSMFSVSFVNSLPLNVFGRLPCKSDYKAMNNSTCMLFLTCTVRIVTFLFQSSNVKKIVCRLFTLVKTRLTLKFYLKIQSLWNLKVKTIAAVITGLKVT